MSPTDPSNYCPSRILVLLRRCLVAARNSLDRIRARGMAAEVVPDGDHLRRIIRNLSPTDVDKVDGTRVRLVDPVRPVHFVHTVHKTDTAVTKRPTKPAALAVFVKIGCFLEPARVQSGEGVQSLLGAKVE